jgi:hypothetical protein
MAGWGAILWGTEGELTGDLLMIHRFTAELNLDTAQEHYVINGYWCDIPGLVNWEVRRLLGKREVIRYMKKALEAKDVMVSIDKKVA